MTGKYSTHTPILRTFSLAFTATILMAVALIPALAQNAVPPTARQAAALPEYASRLHPRAAQAANQSPASFRPRSPLPQDWIVYENGPVNGSVDAWTINFGYVVSDSFLNGTRSSVSGFDFWVWKFPGDVVTAVDWSVTSAPNGGTIYGSGTAKGSNLVDRFISSNQYGYNIDKISVAGLNVSVGTGTFYLNLQNAAVPSGDPVYWDENSGVGCHSQGCPSLAVDSVLGTIPSETFDIVGGGPPPPPPCFGSGGNLQIIHDFTAQEGAASGVTIDTAGNLYGTTGMGGDDGAGSAFKLARQAGWALDPLYSFAGGYNGGKPTGVIVGPDGSLYGGAQGGIVNCNGGCGLIFNVKPSPTACRTALCSWMESVLYRSSGGADPSIAMSVSAFDAAGNLYGTSLAGGDHGFGAVFKLTPSGGGWTESTLYSFTGGSDASGPSQVLVGNDGNLYGVAGGGAYGQGVVFQLSPSGDHWLESVLHSFQWSTDGSNPSYLIQDSSGNLYGIATMYSKGTIFMLTKSGDGWVFSEYYIEHPYGSFEFLNNLAMDAAGNFYGTGNGGEGCRGDRCNGNPDTTYNYYGYLFTASHGSDGWQYRDLAFFGNYDFSSTGAVALDPQGNVYGTTRDCGKYNVGTIWQISP